LINSIMSVAKPLLPQIAESKPEKVADSATPAKPADKSASSDKAPVTTATATVEATNDKENAASHYNTRSRAKKLTVRDPNQPAASTAAGKDKDAAKPAVKKTRKASGDKADKKETDAVEDKPAEQKSKQDREREETAAMVQASVSVLQQLVASLKEEREAVHKKERELKEQATNIRTSQHLQLLSELEDDEFF